MSTLLASSSGVRIPVRLVKLGIIAGSNVSLISTKNRIYYTDQSNNNRCNPRGRFFGCLPPTAAATAAAVLAIAMQQQEHPSTEGFAHFYDYF